MKRLMMIGIFAGMAMACGDINAMQPTAAALGTQPTAGALLQTTGRKKPRRPPEPHGVVGGGTIMPEPIGGGIVYPE